MMKPKNTKELEQSSMFPATKLCSDMPLFRCVLVRRNNVFVFVYLPSTMLRDHKM